MMKKKNRPLNFLALNVLLLSFCFVCSLTNEAISSSHSNNSSSSGRSTTVEKLFMNNPYSETFFADLSLILGENSTYDLLNKSRVISSKSYVDYFNEIKLTTDQPGPQTKAAAVAKEKNNTRRFSFSSLSRVTRSTRSSSTTKNQNRHRETKYFTRNQNNQSMMTNKQASSSSSKITSKIISKTNLTRSENLKQRLKVSPVQQLVTEILLKNRKSISNNNNEDAAVVKSHRLLENDETAAITSYSSSRQKANNNRTTMAAPNNNNNSKKKKTNQNKNNNNNNNNLSYLDNEDNYKVYYVDFDFKLKDFVRFDLKTGLVEIDALIKYKWWQKDHDYDESNLLELERKNNNNNNKKYAAGASESATSYEHDCLSMDYRDKSLKATVTNQIQIFDNIQEMNVAVENNDENKRMFRRYSSIEQNVSLIFVCKSSDSRLSDDVLSLVSTENSFLRSLLYSSSSKTNRGEGRAGYHNEPLTDHERLSLDTASFPFDSYSCQLDVDLIANRVSIGGNFNGKSKLNEDNDNDSASNKNSPVVLFPYDATKNKPRHKIYYENHQIDLFTFNKLVKASNNYSIVSKEWLLKRLTISYSNATSPIISNKSAASASAANNGSSSYLELEQFSLIDSSSSSLSEKGFNDNNNNNNYASINLRFYIYRRREPHVFIFVLPIVLFTLIIFVVFILPVTSTVERTMIAFFNFTTLLVFNIYMFRVFFHEYEFHKMPLILQYSNCLMVIQLGVLAYSCFLKTMFNYGYELANKLSSIQSPLDYHRHKKQQQQNGYFRSTDCTHWPTHLFSHHDQQQAAGAKLMNNNNQEATATKKRQHQATTIEQAAAAVAAEDKEAVLYHGCERTAADYQESMGGGDAAAVASAAAMMMVDHRCLLFDNRSSCNKSYYSEAEALNGIATVTNNEEINYNSHRLIDPSLSKINQMTLNNHNGNNNNNNNINNNKEDTKHHDSINYTYEQSNPSINSFGEIINSRSGTLGRMGTGTTDTVMSSTGCRNGLEMRMKSIERMSSIRLREEAAAAASVNNYDDDQQRRRRLGGWLKYFIRSNWLVGRLLGRRGNCYLRDCDCKTPTSTYCVHLKNINNHNHTNDQLSSTSNKMRLASSSTCLLYNPHENSNKTYPYPSNVNINNKNNTATYIVAHHHHNHNQQAAAPGAYCIQTNTNNSCQLPFLENSTTTRCCCCPNEFTAAAVTRRADLPHELNRISKNLNRVLALKESLIREKLLKEECCKRVKFFDCFCFMFVFFILITCSILIFLIIPNCKRFSID